MTQKETLQQLRQQCRQLGQDLIRIGLHTGDTGLLTLGNSMHTVLDTDANPDKSGMIDLTQTLEAFCERQIKRAHGMSEAELALDELLTGKLSQN